MVKWWVNRTQRRHLFIDASVASVRTPSVTFRYTRPGCMAREREFAKFSADNRHPTTPLVKHGHRLVPFTVEEGGQLGEHARSLLHELARAGASTGHLKAPATWRTDRRGAIAAHWVRRWQQEISACVHFGRAQLLLDSLDVLNVV